MKRLIIFLLLFAANKVAGQTTGYLRFDTVLIYKQGGPAELILRSSTKDSLGVLVNYSDGRTRFMKSRALNDSTIIIGLDTIVIRGATGGTSGGTGIGEVVGGYGLINVNDSTLRVDTTQIPTQFDISTKVNYSDTASMLSPYLRKVDTTNKWLGIDTRFVDTLYRVNDSTVGFTIRGDAYTIEVKGGVNGGGGGSGTVTSISQGYGITNTPNPITTTGTIDVDSATLSSYYLRRKDSTLYTTVTRLADTAAAIRADFPAGGGTQNIEQTLTNGDSTDNNVNWRPAAGVTNESFITSKWIPSNYNTDYSGAGAFRSSLFQQGWVRVNGVNGSGRPNVVFNVAAYNAPMGGGRILTDEASYRFGLESHFETGGAKLFEFHLPEIFTTTGVPYRGASWYVDKETGKFQLNFLATVGVNFSTIAAKQLFAFSELGNFQFVGRTGSSIITLYNDSTNGSPSRYQINLNGITSVGHNSFGLLQQFDSHTNFANTFNTNPNITVTDTRNNDNMSPIFMNLSSTAAKYAVNAVGSVANGLTMHLRNTSATSFSVYQVTNSGNTSNTQFGQLSASATPIGAILADAGFVRSTSAAGLTLMASNATGDIRFAAGSTAEKARLTTTGSFGLGPGANVDRFLHIEQSDAATNSVTYLRRATHITSGAVAAGFGIGEEEELENFAGTNAIVFRRNTILTNASAGSETVDHTIDLIASGSLAEKFRLFSNGNARFGGGLFLGSIANGTPGTDSIVVINNTEIKKILASYYASQSALNDTAAALRGSFPSAVNIYNTDGTLAGNRTVTMSGNTLNFAGGNVGFSTTGPDRKLDILDAAAAQLRLTHADGTVYTDAQTDANGVLNITPTGRYISTPTGTTTARGYLPSLIWNELSVVTSSGTTETDLYTFTTRASELSTDGESLEFTVHGYVGDASGTKTLRAYWAGTEVFEAATTSAVVYPYDIKVIVMRTSSTNARIYAKAEGGGFAFTSSGETNPRIVNVTTTFTNTNIIKVTGQSSDGGTYIDVQGGFLKWLPSVLPPL